MACFKVPNARGHASRQRQVNNSGNKIDRYLTVVFFLRNQVGTESMFGCKPINDFDNIINTEL